MGNNQKTEKRKVDNPDQVEFNAPSRQSLKNPAVEKPDKTNIK